jgi:NAD(P)H-hydrate epimerase
VDLVTDSSPRDDIAETTLQLEKLFREVGQRHHEAFLDTDGVDPEWPLWYADWLMDRLPDLLDAELTKSELVYLLLHLSKKQPHEAPDMPWPRYYARFFARQYGQKDS